MEKQILKTEIKKKGDGKRKRKRKRRVVFIVKADGF
jgi:hypothetical protein